MATCQLLGQSIFLELPVLLYVVSCTFDMSPGVATQPVSKLLWAILLLLLL